MGRGGGGVWWVVGGAVFWMLLYGQDPSSRNATKRR